MFGWEHSPSRNTTPISGTSRRTGGNERPTHDGHLDRFPKIAALFTAGAQVATNATEHLRSAKRGEAPGDLLAHLDPADVLLALVVGVPACFVPRASVAGTEVP